MKNNLKELIEKKRNLIYFVFDYNIYSKLSIGSIENIINEAVDAGVDIIQYRDKIRNKRDIFYTAQSILEICKEKGVVFIMNDHLDIAKAIGADGAHLGQEDFPINECKKLNFDSDFILGVSTHNKKEIEEAIDLQKSGVLKYFNIGPIFDTQTKEHVGNGIGTALVEYVAKEYPDMIFSVMGGIKHSNILQPLSAGAKIFAVVTEILNDKDSIKNSVIKLRKIVDEGEICE